MICPKCQTPNRANAKFCDECGYELPSIAPVAKEMFDDGQDKVCKPKSAPTADLNGIDNYNDSSFSDSDITQIINSNNKEQYKSVEDNTNQANSKVVNEEQGEQLIPDVHEQKTEVIDDINSSAKTATMAPIKDESSAEKYYSPNSNYSSSNVSKKNNMDPKTKRNVIIACATIAIVGAILAITYFAQMWGGKVVPDVVGKDESSAIEILNNAGFRTETEYISSDDIEGIVLSTNPQAGNRLEVGSTIKMSISIKRVIPELKGMKLDDAKAILEKNGFTNINIEYEKSDEEENTILVVSPEPNTRAKADSLVTLKVAQNYVVPNVAGMTKQNAIDILSASGFKANIKTQYSETIEEGCVISSDPAGETKLKSGSAVTIYIAERKSTKLENATKEFFNGASKFTIDEVKYELGNLQGVQYTSGGTVSFTITARKYDTVTWFGTTSETRYMDYETIQGAISYDDNENIIAISPNIKQGV